MSSDLSTIMFESRNPFRLDIWGEIIEKSATTLDPFPGESMIPLLLIFSSYLAFSISDIINFYGSKSSPIL